MDNIIEEQQLSRHFSLREMTASGTAIKYNIDNTPGVEDVERMKALCRNILEPLRSRFGVIRVTSGYRSKALNEKVGGNPASQHLRGEAADIHVSSGEVARKMFGYVRDNLDFDQLLYERRKSDGACWLHVSHRAAPGKNRHDSRTIIV